MTTEGVSLISAAQNANRDPAKTADLLLPQLIVREGLTTAAHHLFHRLTVLPCFKMTGVVLHHQLEVIGLLLDLLMTIAYLLLCHLLCLLTDQCVQAMTVVLQFLL